MCTIVTIWSTVSHTCTTGFQVMALEFAFLNDGRTMDPSPVELAQHVSAFVRLSIVQGVKIYLKLILNKKVKQ